MARRGDREGEDREDEGEQRGRRGRDVVLVSVTRAMSLKETDEEYVNCLVDYPAGAVYYFFREFRARKEYR